MNTQKQNRKLPLLVALATATLLFQGCAKQQYVENPELKKSIVILIKKVERLEAIHASGATRKTKYIQKKQRTTKAPKVAKKTKYTGKTTNAYISKNKHSKVVAEVPISSGTKLIKCDKFGWCKTSKYKGYVQKWRFSK